MKTKSLIVAMATIGLIGISHAEEGKKARSQKKLPPEVMEKFDKDKDGKLDESERKAARAARREMMKARRKKMMEKFDKNGDGKLNKEEKKAAHAAMEEHMTKRFDKDGDGVLNDGEKAEMKKAMKNRPGAHRGPRGKGGKGRKGGGDAEAPGAGEN